MMEQIRNLVEKLTGRAKQVTGDAIDDEDLRNQGEAQENKAEARQDAEHLDKLAEEKEQKAAGYKGEEQSRAES